MKQAMNKLMCGRSVLVGYFKYHMIESVCHADLKPLGSTNLSTSSPWQQPLINNHLFVSHPPARDLVVPLATITGIMSA